MTTPAAISVFAKDGVVRRHLNGESIAVALVLILASVPYLYSCSFGLLEGWDDQIYVSGNIARLSPGIGNICFWLSNPREGCYLPLTMFSYMADYSLWGLDGRGYRIQNLFWHLVCVAAIFKVFRFFGARNSIAFAFSLVFAIHPQRAESVVWISERKDVLCAAFYFWSIFLYLRGVKGKNKIFVLASFISFVLALLSKPMAISLPFVLFLLGTSAFGKNEIYSGLKRLAPFFILCLIFIPVTVLSQDIPVAHTTATRQFFVLFHNIQWFVVNCFAPGNLSPIYPKIAAMSFDGVLKISFSYLAIGIVLFLIWKRDRCFFRASILPQILCFFVSVLPVSGLVPLGAIDYADRYSYIPTMFLWLAAGLFANKIISDSLPYTRKRPGSQFYLRRVAPAFFGVYALFLGVATFYHSQTWKNYRSVLESACLHSPPAVVAMTSLAELELYEGNYEAAAKMAEGTLEQNMDSYSDRAKKSISLRMGCVEASALYRLDRKKEAHAIFEKIGPDISPDSFSSPDLYSSFRNMSEECRKENGKP